ncbi:MAG: sigma-70 family RNA polymerase sigma factor [Lachnospiraceae bacterium]|nr:sigma-70 family RNA polymerase sigma factor [Lachnospiraceae bacterium]
MITENLIKKAQTGDKEAFAEIYNDTIKTAYYVAKRILLDDDATEDVLQESYIAVFKNLGDYKTGNFQGWVDTIVANRAKNYLRKKNPIFFSEMETEDNPVVEFEEEKIEFKPDEKIDYDETKRLVLDIVDGLPADQRLSIILFYYEEKSVKEISEICQCSENTIKSRLNYARKKIKEDVLALEKKGTKLYSIPAIPFLVWMLSEEAKACAVPEGAAAILAGVEGVTGSVSATAATEVGKEAAKEVAKAVAEEAAKETAKATVGAAIKTAAVKAGMTVGTKIAIAATAATLAVGGTVAGVVLTQDGSGNEVVADAPTHEHNYTSAVTKEPTCEEDGQGEITYTCECGDTYIEKTDRIDHCTDDIEIIREATCSQTGIKTYSCIFCGREFEREELPKLPHTESDWIVVTEVTGTTDGLQHMVCTVCGEETASEVISSETYVVASGTLAEGRIQWEIVGTTLYVNGTGAIPDFEQGGPWYTNFGDRFPDMKPVAWQMYYKDVDEIILSEGITAIGKNNFFGFSKVTSMTFPSTLTKIGMHGMNAMGLTSLEIPKQITEIGLGAFQNLTNLTYVFIPSNIKTIPECGFCGCYNLSKIEIEYGVEKISADAFSILAYYDLDGVRHGGSPGFEIYVPESVTKIGDFAFATGDSYGPITVYGKAGSYVEQWVENENTQPEVTFVAQ